MLKNAITKEIGTRFQFESERINLYISCYCKGTKNGFKHFTDFITLDIKNERDYVYPLDIKNRKELKINYINRTWEKYTYQTLLSHVLYWLKNNGFITKEELQQFEEEIR